MQGDEFDNSKTVAFPFYRNFGLHNSLKSVDVELWAYVDGEEGSEGPPFKDLGTPPLAAKDMTVEEANGAIRLSHAGNSHTRFFGNPQERVSETPIARRRGILPHQLQSRHDVRHHD